MFKAIISGKYKDREICGTAESRKEIVAGSKVYATWYEENGNYNNAGEVVVLQVLEAIK